MVVVLSTFSLLLFLFLFLLLVSQVMATYLFSDADECGACYKGVHA